MPSTSALPTVAPSARYERAGGSLSGSGYGLGGGGGSAGAVVKVVVKARTNFAGVGESWRQFEICE